MKQLFKVFTGDDARRANDDLIAGKNKMPSGLSPVSNRILREFRFSRDEINRAFAEAHRVVSGT
jgi:hypothetical protein